MKHILAVFTLLFTAQAFAEPMQGRLEWARRVDLATTVDGIVREVAARPGRFVAEGDVLVRLDAGEYEARVLAAQARVARAQPVFEEAQREWARAEELYERTVLSDYELQQARIAFAAARADRDEALAQRMEAEVHLARTRIVAPFDAMVLAVSAVPGQAVVNRLRPHPLVTVADGRRMAVHLTVPAARIGDLSVGAKVPVTVKEQTYAGTITEIGLEPSSPGDYPVTAAFRFGKTLLRAGGSAWVDLDAE